MELQHNNNNNNNYNNPVALKFRVGVLVSWLGRTLKPWLATLLKVFSIVAKSIYNILDVNDNIPVEQRGCKKESRGTKHQLLIDKTILRDCRRRHTNLGMAWIDYKKAYDMVPHSWILESLELVQVSNNILEFVKRSMANWQTELTSCRESLAKVNIRGWIFQGVSL